MRAIMSNKEREVATEVRTGVRNGLEGKWWRVAGRRQREF